MKDFFKDITELQDYFSAPIEINKEVPEHMPKYTSENFLDISSLNDRNNELFGSLKEGILRDEYIKHGMFGFVSWKWIIPLISWINGRKCLEIMAGRGWLSHALRLKDVDVIATDNFSWHTEKWNDTLTEIENIDAVKAIEKYAKQIDIVIVSWPYIDDITFKCLEKLHTLNPSAYFVFIGEWNDYVCADKDFYDAFETIESDELFNQAALQYERWFGIKDHLYLGKYKK